MKNNEVEEMLMKGTSLEDLIKMKIESEFMDDLKKSKEIPKQKTIADIKEVPTNKIFSKEAVFRCFNRKTKLESLINGLQADSLIGAQNYIREKMLKGELSAFTTDDAYVKFEKVNICQSL